MKKILVAGVLGFMLSGFMSSCSKDDSPVDYGKPYDEEEGYESSIVTKAGSYSQIIKFEGKTYNVPCALENDSLIFLDDDLSGRCLQ